MPDGISFRRLPLGFLIRWAYGLDPYQAFQTVGPDWLEPGAGSPRFDIVAKTDQIVPVQTLRLMLRSLLAERLHLMLHTEMKELSVVVLSSTGRAAGLREATLQTDDEGTVKASATGLRGQGATMAQLILSLTTFVPYLLVDESGMAGHYDFDLDWTNYADESVPGPNGRRDFTPGLNLALRKMGLKLEQKRRAEKVFVIDRADRMPAEN